MYDSFTTSTKNVRFDVRHVRGRLFFQDFILPVLKTQRLLGFAPFYIERGKIAQGYNRATTLYGILSYTIVILFTLTTQHQIVTKEIRTENVSFNAALVGYLKLLSLTQQLLGPLPFIVQKSNFQRFLTKWMEVQNGRGYTSLIEAYRLLWMNLCNITNYFASSIGATITVCLVFHVLYLILAAYRTVTSVPELLRNSQPWSIPPILIDLLFHLAVILFFCNVGQNVVKYCTNNMLNTILGIKEQSQYRNYDEARVNIFLYTINEYEPLVSVCGFYEINRSLFGGVVSILLTYMIVIIQLKDSI
ncbi:gustatory and odorant receptor 63a-like [Planococcus citri]|uniref:gustatory and odorant receptor 63a-like n=1 Tax=Planococcus citri TaxID=170843 RepID=UPI0031F89087